jgi:hypothetical protein
LLHDEVHYYIVLVCTEANSILRAVKADTFFNCWCFEMSLDNIQYEPRYVHYHMQGFSDLFQTANGFLPGGSVTTTIQHTNARVTCTIHISHKIPLTTNKQQKHISSQCYTNSEGHCCIPRLEDEVGSDGRADPMGGGTGFDYQQLKSTY